MQTRMLVWLLLHVDGMTSLLLSTAALQDKCNTKLVWSAGCFWGYAHCTQHGWTFSTPMWTCVNYNTLIVTVHVQDNTRVSVEHSGSAVRCAVLCCAVPLRPAHLPAPHMLNRPLTKSTGSAGMGSGRHLHTTRKHMCNRLSHNWATGL
jgi:hypothetical protein